MSNPYYTRLFNPAPLTFARSGEVIAEYERVKQGFDALDLNLAPSLVEVAAARQGQASLLLNLQRFITTFAPAPGNVDMGGYLLRNGGAPVLAGDMTTKDYVDGLVISATAPTWIVTEPDANKTLAPYEAPCPTVDGVDLQLPASPEYGRTRVFVRCRAGLTLTITRNGLPIMGLEEDLDLSDDEWCVLVAFNATQGWVLE